MTELNEITISVITNTELTTNERIEINAKKGINVLDALRDNDIYIPAVCAGRAVCGKCGVKLLSGTADATDRDKAFFNEEKLARGYRLACTLNAYEDICIEILSEDEKNFVAVTEYKTGEDIEKSCDNNCTENKPRQIRITSVHVVKIINNGESAAGQVIKQIPGHTFTLSALKKFSSFINSMSEEIELFAMACDGKIIDINDSVEFKAYGVAIDIGSTTVAAEIIDLFTGQTTATRSFINRQREFGADVISRIRASGTGQLKRLGDLIREDIIGVVKQLAADSAIQLQNIYKITIAGNNTMLHLLLGTECGSIGTAPFTPVFNELIEFEFNKIFNNNHLDCSVTLLPSIGAYVGADIVSGLYMCEEYDSTKPFLFIDLGTNGEMAIMDDKGIMAASTAAGPAFEGGNISQGTGSVRGAICNAVFTDGAFQIETINGAAPIGICGSGVIDIVSELLSAEMIDETGLLENCPEDKKIAIYKDIYFTQKDIREIQLAKSAIRAGVEKLLEERGLTYDDIYKVYLAGGFGHRVNIRSCVNIGLLPPELLNKIEAVGNSSLGGARLLLTDKNGKDKIADIAARSTELSLSGDARFNELYIEYMCF